MAPPQSSGPLQRCAAPAAGGGDHRGSMGTTKGRSGKRDPRATAPPSKRSRSSAPSAPQARAGAAAAAAVIDDEDMFVWQGQPLSQVRAQMAEGCTPTKRPPGWALGWRPPQPEFSLRCKRNDERGCFQTWTPPTACCCCRPRRGSVTRTAGWRPRAARPRRATSRTSRPSHQWWAGAYVCLPDSGVHHNCLHGTPL